MQVRSGPSVFSIYYLTGTCCMTASSAAVCVLGGDVCVCDVQPGGTVCAHTVVLLVCVTHE